MGSILDPLGGILHYYKSLGPLGCDSTIVLAVARLSAPATIATHSRVIRLRRVLTDFPPSGSSTDPTSGGLSYALLKASSFLSVTNCTEET